MAKDLQHEFPGIEGFSRTNVFRMRAFYEEYKTVPPVVGQIEELEHLGVLTQIPWSHNIILMEKIKNIEQRLWYAEKTLKKLPKAIDALLPPIEEIEEELEKDVKNV